MSINFSSRRFDFLSWSDAENASRSKGSTVLWPFGAVEQHGTHLPLATDHLFAERISEEVLLRLADSLPIWSLPSQSIGFSPEHASFPGTLSLSASLLMQLVMEVGEQLSSLGIQRLVLFNAHGGQIGLLQAAARQLRMKCPSMAVLPCFLWSGVPSLKELIPSEERINGLHAGLAETSLMMSLAPELVGPDRHIDGDHFSGESVATPPMGWSLEGSAPCAWLTKDLSVSGVIGNNQDANTTLGEALRDALIRHWVYLLTNLMESDWPPVER